MKVRSFFDYNRESEEHLDVTTTHTIPDQSLSVRDILTRFSRGQMVIPPIDTGEDDDINCETSEYEDLVDAHNSIIDASNNLGRMQAEARANAGVTAKQSEALTEAPPEATASTPNDI